MDTLFGVRRMAPFTRIPGVALAMVLALAMLLLAAAQASATTVQLGQLATAKVSSGGCSNCNYFQVAVPSVDRSYTVPPGSWTLTSWSAWGAADGGGVRLRVYRPTGVKSEQFKLIAESAEENAVAEKVTTYPVQIPVAPGDLIGVESGSDGKYVDLDPAATAGDELELVQGVVALGAIVGPADVPKTFRGPGRVNIAATLTSNTTTFSIAKVGTGMGTVTSIPVGIDCGLVCSAVLDIGTPIGIQATPAPGSVFAGWSGGGCAGTTNCGVKLAGPITVTAKFDPTNAIKFGKLTRNTGNGSAKLAVVVPGSGSLVLKGKGLKRASRHPARAGTVTLPIHAKGRSLAKLVASGARKFTASIVFVPTGGTPNTRRRHLKLIDR